MDSFSERDLSFLEKIIYSHGSCNEGITSMVYTFKDDCVTYETVHTFHEEPLKAETVFPLSKDEVIKGLKKLHMETWKNEYYDPEYMEEGSWEIELCFKDRDPVHYYGIHAYPDSFSGFVSLLKADE